MLTDDEKDEFKRSMKELIDGLEDIVSDSARDSDTLEEAYESTIDVFADEVRKLKEK